MRLAFVEIEIGINKTKIYDFNKDICQDNIY